jgi:hypothetical protein
MFETIATTPSAWTECSLSVLAWTEQEVSLGEIELTDEFAVVGEVAVPVVVEAFSWVEPDLSPHTWTEREIS